MPFKVGTTDVVLYIRCYKYFTISILHLLIPEILQIINDITFLYMALHINVWIYGISNNIPTHD